MTAVVEDYKSYPKFKGSKTLRPANVEIDYTADQALEMLKCINDVSYFCENYLKIRTLDHGIQPFNLRKYQKESIELIAKEKLIIMKWGRQPFALDTLIHTTRGVKRIDKVRKGDVVYGSDNQRITVTSLSPIYEDSNTYRITFSNGEFIECDEDHIWEVNGDLSDTKTIASEYQTKDLTVECFDAGFRTKILITNVEQIESKLVRCIETDAPDGLCLIGKTKIVSSNSGKTTTAAAALVWLLLFNKQYETGVLAHKEKQAKEILKRIKLYYELLPYWMQSGVTAWNATSLDIESGSKIFAAASSPDSIRGSSLNCVFMDEFAILGEELAEDLFTSTFPTISSGENTKFIIASTPKGLNKFYKIWTEAKEGINGFVPFEINYWDVPGRDHAWAAAEISRIGQAKFDQEYSAEFMGSSNTLIDGRKIPSIPYINPVMMDPEELLHIFETPVPNTQYVMTVDCSEGVGGDYSTFTVFDVSQLPYRIVATYANDMITTLIYPNVIFDVAQYFNNAFVVIESNTIGAEVANILFYDLEYENILSSNATSKRGELDESPRSFLGIKTTKKTKHLGCSNLKTLVEQDQLVVNCYRVLYEMARFVKKGGSFKAEPGEHDDLMMNLVTFAWLTTQNSFKELTNTDLRIAMNQRTMNEQDYLPRGIFVNNGLAEEIGGIVVVDEIDAWLLE